MAQKTFTMCGPDGRQLTLLGTYHCEVPEHVHPDTRLTLLVDGIKKWECTMPELWGICWVPVFGGETYRRIMGIPVIMDNDELISAYEAWLAALIDEGSTPAVRAWRRAQKQAAAWLDSHRAG